jgi:hypothetical protein
LPRAKYRLFVPIVLAAAMTGLNALKPPCIDDTAYLAVARQIAAHPLDPYGFDQFWYDRPQPANEVLAPPVLPYWLGLGIAIFGGNIVALKLWLFPIALLLTVSLRELLSRFASGVETPVLVGLALSPEVLPGFNFMLDVPELALAMAAMAVMLRALARDSLSLAGLAGALAGLAAQTKYTGLIVPPLLLGAGLIRRRLLIGVLAAGVAAVLFGGWETFTAWLYGRSHFQMALGDSGPSLGQRLLWLPGAGTKLIGSLGSPLVVLALAGWGRPRAAIVAALLIVVGLVAVAVVPDTRTSSWVAEAQRDGPALARLLNGVWGIALLIVVALTCLRLAWRWPLRWRLRRDVQALLLWVALEWLGYFAMTPFPAARRVMGILVVTTFVLAHFASRTRFAASRWPLWIASLVSAALGLFLAGIDTVDSRLEPAAVREAVAFIRKREPDAHIWFTGHWGTQYEAERLGLRPIIPGHSVLRDGDWFIDGPTWIAKQEIQNTDALGPPEHVVRLDRAFRLRTLPSYYGGDQPIEWWPSPMQETRIYRLRATWTPRS